MPFGFVMTGMVLGLISAALVLISGAGLALAFLAYAGIGTLGTLVAVGVALMGQNEQAPLPALAS